MENKATYLKDLRLIHSALMVGAILFVVFTTQAAQIPLHFNFVGNDMTYIIVAGGMLFFWMASAVFSYNVRVKKARESFKGMAKLNEYRTIIITKLAMLEGPVLFCVIVTFITGNAYGIFLAIPGLTMMLFNRPSEVRMIEDLALTPEERVLLGE